MRYIGNKDLIAPEILKLLKEKGLLNKSLTFFDAFCGTGSVSDAVKGSFNVIANDILSWCVLYSRGRLSADSCNFKKLDFNPFEFFNSNKKEVKGFMFKNYSPGGSKRMYFTPENAARIDYFRTEIENWKKKNLISENEYCYLLSCLIESVSKVSNTAGVYGAFLKHWDPRAQKPIEFVKVSSKKLDRDCKFEFYNDKTENIASEVDCDVLYIDPPYTQNQYGTQYHLLETLVLNDNPEISPITGSRTTAPMRSDWSKMYKAHLLFDRILAKTKAKYILFSYNNDGLMSKSFIEASLKRYGKKETYVCKKINYKKYRNFKTKGNKEHFEYLFFIEKKKSEEIYYESPLNYIGSKSKMIKEIKENLPSKFDSFADIFGGGFNVGLNIDANKIIYNDINYFVKEILESFRTTNTYDYLMYIRRMIKKFGLEKANSKSYLKAREYYNSLSPEKKDPRLLYTIILYGFQQQMRFNGNHSFNNPVGMRWFNDKVLEKFISFSRVLKEKEIVFECSDYVDLLKNTTKNTFVYMDPPYKLTNGSYNDGKRGFLGWTEDLEQKFLLAVDEINKRNVRFMISYVLEHKGKINKEVKRWVSKEGYRIIKIKTVPGINRKEILIVNYDKHGKTTLYNKKQSSKRRV
ncbi:MAG: DNA adenine methylase [Candidatus Pacearchaeota archaeon]|nr:DNA adenine methylase [Candidatus Pacearchaeota archaeon]